MIKLISLGAFPLLAAFLFGQPKPQSMLPPFHAVAEADRIFLANLDSQDAATLERTARNDREFLVALQARQPAPVAVPVSTPIPVRAAIPILPAVRPRLAASAVAASGASIATAAVPLTSAVHNETSAANDPEVRRAIPVASHRSTILIYHGEVFTFPPLSAR